MNWEALGAIGELVGAVAVVASLAYLAVQIRQSTSQSRLNTTVIQASAFQQLLDHHSTIQVKAVDDPALLDVLESDGDTPLDTADGRRFLIWATALFRSHFNAWCLMEKGLISEDQLEVLGGAIARVRSNALQEAWARRREDFPSDFANAFDKRFEV